MDTYTLIKDILGFISIFLSFYLFMKFYAISKVVDKDALRMVKQLKTMFGEQLVDVRIKGTDLRKVQQKNRALIGAKIKSKTFGLLEDVPDKDVVASVMDRDLMTGLFWLSEKAGGALGSLKNLISGEEGEKKGSGRKGKFGFQ